MVNVVQDNLENKGIRVYVVPEVATLMGSAGCVLDCFHMSEEFNLDFSANMLKLQRELEDRITAVAVSE